MAAAGGEAPPSRILTQSSGEWKSDATSPSPRKYFAPFDHRPSVHRPSAGGRVGSHLCGLCALLAACQVLPEMKFARTLPLSRSPHAGRHRRAERHVESCRQPATPRVSSPIPATHHCSTITSRPCATSAHRRCSPAIMWNFSSTARAPTPPCLRPSSRRATYILVESFIFEEAVRWRSKAEPLLSAAAARGVKVHVLYDAVGSLTTDAKFLDGLRARRHLAVRLQSAESAR